MREQEIRVLEQRLSQLTHQVEDIEREMEQANARLRETYSREIKGLEGKRRRAASLLAELRLEEAKSWQEQNIQTGLFRILDDIGDRLSRVMSRRRRH